MAEHGEVRAAFWNYCAWDTVLAIYPRLGFACWHDPASEPAQRTDD